jgi:hypothetical protein
MVLVACGAGPLARAPADDDGGQPPDSPSRSEADAGRGPPAADGGVDAGAGTDAGLAEAVDDGGLEVVELVPGTERIVAVAAESLGDDTLIAWIPVGPDGARLLVTRIDGRGRRLWRQDVAAAVPDGGRPTWGALVPHAISPVDGGVRVAALLGSEAVRVEVDARGHARVFDTMTEAFGWAFDDGAVLWTKGPGLVLRSSAGRSVPIPGTAGVEAPVVREGALQVLSVTDERLAVARADAGGWEQEVVTEVAPTSGHATAVVEGFALEADAPGSWTVGWGEGSVGNPRRVDLRVRRRGGAARTLASETAWYRLVGALEADATTFAVAWAAAGGGFNQQLLFTRGAATCQVNEGTFGDASIDAVALTRAGRALSLVWTEPAPAPTFAPRHRLMVARVGPAFCR